jgi:hypothetical protein
VGRVRVGCSKSKLSLKIFVPVIKFFLLKMPVQRTFLLFYWILQFYSELGFVGFQDERIKKKSVLILQSFNPINPNSDIVTGFFNSLPTTLLFIKSKVIRKAGVILSLRRIQ